MRRSSAAFLALTFAGAGACGRVGFETTTTVTLDGSDASIASGGSGTGTGGRGNGGARAAGGALGAAGASGARSSGGATGALEAGLPEGAPPDGSLADGSAPANCGDGVVDGDEDCDTRGASATCDADCTFASCGDGVVNAAAGEGCDDGDQLGSCSLTCQPVTCRAGCVCEWYRGTRYMLCAEQLAYAPARTACAEQHMRPVRITSTTESVWLRLRTQQQGFGKFHLGATDGAPEGRWVWDDGTPFWQGVANGTPIGGEFEAWATGEPNSFVADENCSEVQSIQGWNDCVCDIAKPFVCKQSRDVRPTCGNGIVEAGEACDDGSATATCDADCSRVVCGDGLVNAGAGEACDDGGSGQYCQAGCGTFQCPSGCACVDVGGRTFALCTAARTFRDAGVACGRAGMTLARATSNVIDQALRSRADQSTIGEFWIGGFDIDGANEWRWSDLTPLWSGTAAGTAHGYAHFAAGAPAGTANMDCISVLPTGTWQIRDCAGTRAYACEKL